jgi:peptidyl-prolyl cis-trans isomerase D
MATLQKIRNRAGVLVAVVIGLALLAFILGDIMQSGNSLFQRRRLEIADIEGKSYQYLDFQKEVEELSEIYILNTGETQIDENTLVQLREQTWQNLVRDALMNDVYDDLGLTVSSEELYDMIQGSNIHPIVQQIFQNPNTGQIDRASIIRFLKSLEAGATPEQRAYWLYLEQEIAETRIMEKYNNLIKKGLYVTNEEAQQSLNRKNQIVTFDYAALPYASVPDSLVTLTEKDLRNYYEAHQDDYKQESSRKIEYIIFPVTASEQDRKETEEWMNEIKPAFMEAEDNVQFVQSNSDESFDDTWYKLEELPVNIMNWMDEEDPAIHDVLGPYFSDGSFYLAKFHASEMRPDSVRARHILLTINNTAELESKQALADSLKQAIEKGSHFAGLAREFSEDQGSAINGGDVGFFAHEQMVKPFADAAFNNEEGEISIVTSQYGLHVVQTTDRGREVRKYQIAYLVRNLVPSDETYQKIYAEVSRFASENTTKEKFDEAVVEQNMNKRSAVVGENDRNVPGLANSRILIRAAYDAEEGNMLKDYRESTIFELGDNFILGTVVDVKEEGISPFEEVRDRIELAVLKEKKAEYLMEKASEAMADEDDLVVLAQELGSEVQTAKDINFSSASIPGVGLEPALTGLATTLEEGQLSGPVKGNNGVYIVQVTGQSEGNNLSVAAEQETLTRNLASRADLQAYEAIKNAAEIEDKRSKFY